MKWEGDKDGKDMHLEDDSTQGFDQFAVNAQKFGYKSSFDMDLYTTPLDKDSAFYKANEARAARLAAEIEGKTAHTLHQAEERGQDELFDEADEEDRYSGVHSAAAPRPGHVYVPPHLRKEPAVIPPPASAAPQPSAMSPAPASPAPAASPLAAPSPVTAEGKERKKLSLNPGASAFKPGFNISFSPAPAPAPTPVVPAPAPVVVVVSPMPMVAPMPVVLAPMVIMPSSSPPPSPAAVVPGSPASPAASISFKEKLRLAAQKLAAEERGAATPVFVPQQQQQQQPTIPQSFVPTGFVAQVPYGPPSPAQQSRPFTK